MQREGKFVVLAYNIWSYGNTWWFGKRRKRGERYISLCYFIAFNLHNLLASLLHDSDGRIEFIQEVRDGLSSKYILGNRHCSYPGIDFKANTLISPRRRNSWDRHPWKGEERTTLSFSTEAPGPQKKWRHGRHFFCLDWRNLKDLYGDSWNIWARISSNSSLSGGFSM